MLCITLHESGLKGVESRSRGQAHGRDLGVCDSGTKEPNKLTEHNLMVTNYSVVANRSDGAWSLTSGAAHLQASNTD